MKKLIALCAAAALMLSLLSACSKGSEPSGPPAGELNLAGVAQEIQANHEFHSLERVDPEDPEMGELFQNTLDNFYPGLTDLKLKQMEIYMPMISFSGGELALVDAIDADGAAKVKEIFQARVDSKSTEGPGNYPEEVEMWQRSARVAVRGQYVMLVCHEDCDAIVDEFNALFS